MCHCVQLRRSYIPFRAYICHRDHIPAKLHLEKLNIANSPLDDPGKKKNRCTPRGTKVVIYHLVGNFMLNSMQNVVSLATCAESL